MVSYISQALVINKVTLHWARLVTG